VRQKGKRKGGDGCKYSVITEYGVEQPEQGPESRGSERAARQQKLHVRFLGQSAFNLPVLSDLAILDDALHGAPKILVLTQFLPRHFGDLGLAKFRSRWRRLTYKKRNDVEDRKQDERAEEQGDCKR
jgi:hypothetical protein